MVSNYLIISMKKKWKFLIVIISQLRQHFRNEKFFI